MQSLIFLANDITAPTLETPTTAFMKAGLLGAAIVALALVVLHLYNDAKKERDAFIAKLEAIQTTRVNDAQKMTADTVQALTAAGNSSHAQATTNTDVARALQKIEDELQTLRNEVSRLPGRR